VTREMRSQHLGSNGARRAPAKKEKKRCLTCGTEFAPKQGRRYCSPGCRPSSVSSLEWEALPAGDGDREELVGLLWRAARLGSVPAIRLLLDLEKVSGAPSEDESFFDDLARRRRPSG